MGKFETHLQYQVWDSFFPDEGPCGLFTDSSGTTTVFQPLKEFLVINYFDKNSKKSISIDLKIQKLNWISADIYRIEHDLVIVYLDHHNQIIFIDRKTLKVRFVNMEREEDADSAYFKFTFDHFPGFGYLLQYELGFFFFDQDLNEINKVKTQLFGANLLGLKDLHFWFEAYWNDTEAIGFQIYTGRESTTNLAQLKSQLR